METIRYLKVPVKDLRIGMYVVDLDRPWLDTPFLVQGFIIKSVDQLETLSEICQYVYVDTGRSRTFHKADRMPVPSKGALTKEKLEKLLNVRVGSYSDSSGFGDELQTAKTVYRDYETMVARFYNGVRSDQKINMQDVRDPINQIVDSVIRNPDACMLLAKLKRKGDYTYNHAIGSSIWAAALGRQLGLPKKIMLSIATGALLNDVGKVLLSDRLLNKPGKLTADELTLAKSHVAKSIKMLEHTQGVDSIAMQMVLCHHERHDGRGYPRGLKGADIPVYGRIAGIVDCYDALINDTPYRAGMAASEAIKVLYNVRNVDFQAEIVEAFIQAVGIYPAGSLVELSSGEVGVVVAEHRHRRLRPKLLLLTDANKNRLPENRPLDLYETSKDQTGKPLEIAKSLDPGDYGIDPDDIFV